MTTPTGWVLSGTAPHDYEVAVRTREGADEKVARLSCIVSTTAGFGTLMQAFVPEGLRGQRVRLGAWVCTEAVSGWAGLWMRVDGPGREVLAFDNMQDRPLKGTLDGQRYELILPVYGEATLLSFGVLLEGTGAVHIASVTLDAIGPVGPRETSPRLTAPFNLDFAQP